MQKRTTCMQQKGDYVKQSEQTSRLVDVNEIAVYIGLSAHTVYTWVSQRRIPFTFRSANKGPPRAIDEWIAKHSVSPMRPLSFS